VASATPFDTFQLPPVWFKRNRLSSGSDQVVTRHLLVFVGRFQATSDNINLDLHMQVAVGPGSNADHLLASFVVLDDDLYQKHGPVADGSDIAGYKSTNKDQSAAVFQLLQTPGAVVAGTYPKSETLPNYDVDEVGRNVKKVDVNTIQTMKPVVFGKWYDVFIYLGIATDDDVSARIGRNDSARLEDSFIKMYR
jgi:hypothetical protein